MVLFFYKCIYIKYIYFNPNGNWLMQILNDGTIYRVIVVVICVRLVVVNQSNVM